MDDEQRGLVLHILLPQSLRALQFPILIQQADGLRATKFPLLHDPLLELINGVMEIDFQLQGFGAIADGQGHFGVSYWANHERVEVDGLLGELIVNLGGKSWLDWGAAIPLLNLG